MRSLVYRALAVRDLQAIASTTRKQWGEDQALIYVERLTADIGRLREFSLRYPEHRSRAGPFRKMRSGSHLVFYLVHPDEVEIVRIRHVRSDPAAPLL